MIVQIWSAKRLFNRSACSSWVGVKNQCTIMTWRCSGTQTFHGNCCCVGYWSDHNITFLESPVFIVRASIPPDCKQHDLSPSADIHRKIIYIFTVAQCWNTFISDALSVALSWDFLQVSFLPDGSSHWLVHVRKYLLLEEIMTFSFITPDGLMIYIKVWKRKQSDSGRVANRSFITILIIKELQSV